MTDQTQDPQTQNDKNLNQDINQDTGVFGGSDDIFENSDILEPITDITKNNSSDAVQEVVPEIVETMPKIKEEEQQEEKTMGIEHEWEKMDDFFDPFDDSLEEIEENDDVPNFETSPEIDALDDLDNIDLDLETMEEIKPVEVKPVDAKIEETKPEIKDINETIARIEKRAQEVREKAKKLEEETIQKEIREVKIEVPKVEVTPAIKVEKKEIVKERIKEKKKEEIAPVKIKTEVVEEKKSVIKETKGNAKPTVEEERHYDPVAQDIEKVETKPMKTDLQNKFDELLVETKKVYELLGEKDTFEGFDIVGGNDDRLRTTYNVVLSGEKNGNIEINKIELNKIDNAVQEYKLDFVLNKASLNIKVDGELLYDEATDLKEHANKKMQVMEKLNKFIFLISEEFKKIEKDKQKKEKRNIMKGIFRNFMF